MRLRTRKFAFVWLSLFLLGVTSSSTAQAPSGRLQRVETTTIEVGGRPGDAPVRLSLAELMKTYAVPGLSLVVIENYKIVDTKAYGVIELGSKIPVTPKTLFQAGAISKPVAATGALSLVERGRLALDEDVNQKLKTWKVPENEFTKTEKVTLRRLMSHTGGLTVHGFPGYDIDDARPTLVQVLNGEKPANTAAIRVDIVPGTQERYSGGGVTIEQLLMTDVTGKAFSDPDAGAGAGQDWDERQQLRAAIAGGARRNDGERHVNGRQERSRAVAHLSGDGGSGTVDHADRSGEVRD